MYSEGIWYVIGAVGSLGAFTVWIRFNRQDRFTDGLVGGVCGMACIVFAIFAVHCFVH